MENRPRGKSREDFYVGLSGVFRGIHENLPEDGLLVFTFHHTDREGTIWEGLLQTLCDVGSRSLLFTRFMQNANKP